jgi:hypothetical protein
MKKRSDTNPSPCNLYTTFMCPYSQEHKIEGTQTLTSKHTKQGVQIIAVTLHNYSFQALTLV